MIQSIVDANRAQQKRAREFNIRAGRTIFPVMSREELERWLTERLASARRAAEIRDFEVLRFPPLDATEVERLLAECPDMIRVGELELAVEYRAADYYGRPQAPRVKLPGEGAWAELPDAGIRLPDGRSVEVVIPVRWDSVSDTDIPTLKGKVREHLNRGQWEAWIDRPEIRMPDPADDAALIPFEAAVYGRCVSTGEELRAYGTVQASRDWYSEPVTWKAVWYRNPIDAQQAAHTACLELIKGRGEAKEAKVREQIKAQAEAARVELKTLQSREGWGGLEYNLRSRVDSRLYAYLPSTPSAKDYQADFAQTTVLIAEVEVELDWLREGKEEETRAAAEAEEAERAGLDELLDHEYVRGDLNHAREIRRFAEEAIATVGLRRAHAILQDEDRQPYGRGRRADSITRRLPGVEHGWLDWKAGADIVPVVFYLECKLRDEKTTKPIPVAPAPAPAPYKAPESKPAAPAVSPSLDALAALKNKFGRN